MLNDDMPMASFSGYVATTVHALRLVHAAREGIILQHTRPLNSSERRTMIKSGAVFVFSLEESGINRWIDGLLWSPSQLVDNFLVCREVKDDSLSGSGTAAFGSLSLIKKLITVIVEGSRMQLVSYYTIEDKISGKLELPTSRPDIMGLHMPPHIFRSTNFRVPPVTEIGPDGEPCIVESEVDHLVYQHGAWTQILGSSASFVLSDHLHPPDGESSGSRPSWSTNGDSTRSSDNERTEQASNSFRAACISPQDDGCTQYSRRGQDAQTMPPSNDCGIQYDLPKNKGHRRKPRKSRAATSEAEGASRGNRILANQLNPIPLQPWAYYPPSAFVILMPLPIIPFATFVGSDTINSNSWNVTNTYVIDSYNNNSTNLHITKVQGQGKKARRGRDRH